MPRELTGSIVIHRPADEVFAYLRTYENQATWEDFVLEARSEPPGPAQVGTRVHKLRRTPIAEERFTVEVVEMDPVARRWADVAVDGNLADTRIDWQVTPVDGGCRVDVKVTLRASGLWGRILPVVWRTARHQLRMELDSLRRLLEAAPTTATAAAAP